MNSLEKWISDIKKDMIVKPSTEEAEKNEVKHVIKGEVVGILLSADYDPNMRKPFLKFYDIENEKIVIWYDITGHHPYAYSKEDKDTLLRSPEILRKRDYRGGKNRSFT